jgi:glycine/D-amino acid oxidase-like deaminating enzyme
MGTHTTMAQVHPRRLTEALVAASEANIVKATVTGIDRDPTTGVVTAVTLSAADLNGSGSSSSSLRCDAVVFAMGAWARDVVKWFPAVDVALLKRSVGPKYTSVVS